MIRKALPQVRVVYHAHNVEYVLRKQRNGGAIAAITRWAEERLILDCDLATAVSEVDRALIRELYHADTALLPNGVDTFRFTAVGPDKLAKTRAKYGIGNFAIIFSGLHAYPPNRVAIDFLLCEVMPRLLVHLPDAQLIITGGELPCSQRWVIMPGLIPHEELPALIGACAVAAAPVFAGSGTRLKILEAMAANVPVVATSKAAEGLPLLDGQHLLIADDADTFAKSLRRTLTDRELRGGLRSNAREVVAQHFDWRAIVSRNPFSSVCGNVRENASDRSQRP